MPISPQTQAALNQSGINPQVGQELTEHQQVALAFRDTLGDTIAILEGIGPLCTDIDELITMLELAQKNDSQLFLLMSHMSPKRMKVK